MLDIFPATKFKARETTSLNNPSPSPDYAAIINLLGTNNISFPGDLLVQILSKLPVKSLLRFKGVCKPWNFLINSTIFINIHLHRKNPQLAMFPLKHPRYRKVDNPFPFLIRTCIGTCNGIICFLTTNRENPLVLYNPSIREFSFLPIEYRDKFSDLWEGVIVGFCYLPGTQEYKVVSLKFCNENKTVDLGILTLGLEKKSFREVGNVSVPCCFDFNYYGICCGTCMFWLGESSIVMCYDMVEDGVSKIEMPRSPSLSNNHLKRTLGVLKDSLSLFVYLDKDAISFDIFLLIIDDVAKGRSWIKYRTIGPLDTSVVMHPIHESWYDRFILCCKRSYDIFYDEVNNLFHYYDEDANDDDSDVHAKYEKSKDLFYYDLDTNQAVEYKETYPPIEQFVSYVESLVVPNGICSTY